MQHCGVANVIAHKVAELKQAGVAAGDRMLNWMALNFGQYGILTKMKSHELRPHSHRLHLHSQRAWLTSACLLADVHVLDFWVGLAAGCSIVMAPSQQLKDVEAVSALIQQHSIVEHQLRAVRVSAAARGVRWQAVAEQHAPCERWR